MERIKKDMPIDIGRPPRNIFKYHNGFKAVEWRNWIILFSLPLLKEYLDKRYYLFKGLSVILIKSKIYFC